MISRIIAIREKKNLSQEQFAQKIGVSRNFISLVETGKRNLSDRTISNICQTFNVNETWLRTGEGEMFLEGDDAFVNEIAAKYRLSAIDKEAFRLYMKLDENDRKALIAYSFALAGKILEQPALYREYKCERGELPRLSEADIEVEVAAYRAELELIREMQKDDPPERPIVPASHVKHQQEMTREEIHAELDRQLDAEKEATEESSDYGFGCSDAATG